MLRERGLVWGRPIIDRQLRAVLDGAFDGVLIESEERVVYLNCAYAKMLGYPSTSELSKATIRDIAHPEDLERLRWYGLCRKEGKPAPTRYTFHACARGGDTITFDATISQTRVDGELFIMTSVRELQVRAEAQARPASLEIPGAKKLSDRENEVIQHVLQGRRSKEIAILLNISEKTICTHRSRAFHKLALRGERDLFRLASELGLMN
ncbi:MAG TPA: LuxR C-terminal-related transcriptional regulator [Thermoanaerobaculia bacterium]|jgi:PAS domain S-box-containing protein|nr:LuxR C-terminal-related transcriptional regulator [Thermoanaerobaculia bacterium]